jgi:hypothetical protein
MPLVDIGLRAKPDPEWLKHMRELLEKKIYKLELKFSSAIKPQQARDLAQAVYSLFEVHTKASARIETNSAVDYNALNSQLGDLSKLLLVVERAGKAEDVCKTLHNVDKSASKLEPIPEPSPLGALPEPEDTISIELSSPTKARESVKVALSGEVEQGKGIKLTREDKGAILHHEAGMSEDECNAGEETPNPLNEGGSLNFFPSDTFSLKGVSNSLSDKILKDNTN